ncbi:MAG: sigma-54-dependent Fis family transcriptional regulator, partial [Deltaproteobacteria bacterium]|nr:sigma-54-dependent Fis family transcriptional regulator [Deltaproteobacteria bacterium]
AAHGGTLFLDEIAELPLATQAELLRVVERKRLRRVGDFREVEVDARLVTATHQDLAERVRSGAFRADLYHRLCVIPLTVPPLRERKDDIAALAAHVLAQQSAPRRLSAAALAKLKTHDWPGNVRELINTLRRACALCDEETLEPPHLTLGASLKRAARLDDLIHGTVLEVFAQSGRSVARTAKELGVRRATVYRHLRAARIDCG